MPHGFLHGTLGLAGKGQIGGDVGGFAGPRRATAPARDDARPFGRELTYDLEPDASRRARDEATCAVEPEIHAPRLSRMATTIVLVRHGETDWNRENRFQGHADEPLNDVGRDQARQIAEMLRSERIAAVYASPLRRASETAAIVAQQLGLEAHELEALREIDVGDWQGLTITEVKARFPEFAEVNWRSGWSGGESHDELAARVVPALLDLGRRHPGEGVVAITHAGPIRATLMAALALSLEESRKQVGPLPNCAMFRFTVRDGRVELDAVSAD